MSYKKETPGQNQDTLEGLHLNTLMPSLPGELKEVKKRKVWASMPTCCSYNREPDKEQKILFKTFSL